MIHFREFWGMHFSAGGGPITRLVSQRIGAVLAYVAYHIRVSPNILTVLAALTSLAASAVFAMAPLGVGSALLCLVLYQLAYGFDCADGQLARATKKSSPFGGWLDVCGDLLSLVFMAFALLYWLVAVTESVSPIIFLGPFLLVIGRVLVLYSSKFTERSDNGGRPAGENTGLIKTVIWTILDTPTLLVLVCVLRERPGLLMLYLSSLGLAYVLNAGYLGVARLEKY